MNNRKKSKKRGRPSKSRLERRDTIVTFRLTQLEAETLHDYAWRYDQSQGQIIRFCLDVMGVLPLHMDT